VRIESLSSEPVLLPVWIMAYRYQDRLFRFLVNGQTGKPTGQAPTSMFKIALVVAAAIAVVLLVLACVGMLGGSAVLGMIGVSATLGTIVCPNAHENAPWQNRRSPQSAPRVKKTTPSGSSK
jgi:hypothetical protein